MIVRGHFKIRYVYISDLHSMSTGLSSAFGKLPRANYERDLEEEYFRLHYNNLDLDTYVPEYASRLIIKDRSLPMVVRMVNHLQTLRYSCVIQPDGLICTVYSMTVDKTRSSYAYVYSDHDKATDKFTHKYITTCPTFGSADGEYRHRMIPYEQFEQVMKEWADELEPIENFVINAIETQFIKPQVFTFFPRIFSGSSSKFTEQLRQSRMEITGLISNLWCTYHYLTAGTLPGHVCEPYMAIIRQFKAMPAAFKESQRRLSAKGETEFIDRLKSVGQPATGPLGYRAEAGQKLIPLSRIDVINWNDLKYPCWREVYGNILTTELLINYYTPCVPMLIQYFFLQNTNSLMFDNEVQHRRFKNSEIAEDAIKLLKTAETRNLIDSPESELRDPAFTAFSRRIRGLLQNEGNAAIMVDATLGLVSEHTGRTLGDAIKLQEHGNQPDYNPMFLEDPVMFRKYMFEFIYTLYCFNYKLKLFHGDLHANNATIYRRVPKSREMKIVYIVDDSNGRPLIYTVPYNGAFACIIDMSRCILGDAQKISKNFGSEYSREFISNQGDLIAKMIHDSFPELFRKHTNYIMEAVRWKFDAAFKVLCAHDGYRLANEICIMLMKVQMDFKKLKIHPEVQAIASALRDDYGDWYSRHLEMLSSGEISHADQVEWVHLEMMKRHFSMFKCEKPSDIDGHHGELADVFSMMQPMRYELSVYDHLNPLLKLDTVIEQKSLHGMDPSLDIAKLMKYKHDASSSLIELLYLYDEKSPAAANPLRDQ